MSTDPTRFGNQAADAIAAPALTSEIRTRLGTDRAVLVVKVPDGAGPEWAAGRRVRLILLPEEDVAADAERWRSIADQLAEAIRLTREYVGEAMLPAIPGWSWFDATEAYRTAAAEQASR